MADDKNTKPADDKNTKPQAPVVVADESAKRAPRAELAIGQSSGNLTRDSIIETARGKLVADGKTEEEAQKLAVKRGFEMIPE